MATEAKNKIVIICILTILITLCALSACSNKEILQDPINTGEQGASGIGESPHSPETDNIEELTRPLQGEITVMVPRAAYQLELKYYARHFKILHPETSINIIDYGDITDMSRQLELTTRLLAEPPDILVWYSSVTSFEKSSEEMLFEDLYGYFRGPRGIDESKYYSNIFKAAETKGSLYHLPMHIELNFGILNKRLVEGIGMDLDQITVMSIDDEIELYARVAEAFPDETIYADPRFSIYTAFTRERLYDLDSGEVYADTPVMRERLERAVHIPINSQFVQFMPDMIVEGIEASNSVSLDFIRSNNHMMLHMGDSGLFSLAVLFLQEHPKIQFSKPIIMSAGGENNVGFTSQRSLAIMRNAQNKDLAWEFMRYMMEYEDSAFFIDSADYPAARYSLPVNRIRFENQVPEAVDYSYSLTEAVTQIESYINMPPQDFREKQVDIVIDFLHNYMESLNYEIGYSFAVFNSLIYPDIWLLHTGQQDINITLANIQNRLELYVTE